MFKQLVLPNVLTIFYHFLKCSKELAVKMGAQVVVLE